MSSAAASSSIDLSSWIEKLKSSRNRSELFATLDKFRVLEWTDEQRSTVAKLYMRLLDVLPHDEGSSDEDSAKSSGPAKPAEQEEVWYEKM